MLFTAQVTSCTFLVFRSWVSSSSFGSWSKRHVQGCVIAFIIVVTFTNTVGISYTLKGQEATPSSTERRERDLSQKVVVTSASV